MYLMVQSHRNHLLDSSAKTPGLRAEILDGHLEVNFGHIYLLPCFLGPQRTVMQHNSVTRAAVISEMTVQLTLSGGGHVCYKSRRGRRYERGSESGRSDGANYSFKLPRKGKPHSALR